jgi:hypothetical protein
MTSPTLYESGLLPFARLFFRGHPRRYGTLLP